MDNQHTEQEIVEMEAIAATFRANQAAQAKADRDAYMKPLRDLVASAKFKYVRDSLVALATTYSGDDYAAQSVKNNAFGLSWMVDVAAMDLAQPIVAPEPEVEPTPEAESE